MAINPILLQLLGHALKLKRKQVGDRRLSALALAYPDLIVPSDLLDQLFGADFMKTVPQREDAAEVLAYHRVKQTDVKIYDTVALLDRLGVDASIIDIAALRGVERVVDLNDPLPDDLHRRFDIVIDPGTCEHCFNVGMAFRNACEAVAQDGILIHTAPLTLINHGFWGFSPTIYPDYFDANGFRLIHLGGHEFGTLQPFDVHPFLGFKAPDKGMLYVVAQRTEEKPPVWPVQRKYQPMLSKGAAQYPG